MTDSDRSPDQIRADIERTRRELGGDVDAHAVAGDQRLAHRFGLRSTVGALHAARCDGAIQRLQSGLVEQRQRLARGGADEEIEQLAVHSMKPGVKSR